MRSNAGLFTIKQMAWLLLVLGVLDAGFTDIGLRLGLVREANPLAGLISPSLRSSCAEGACMNGDEGET